MKPVVLPNVMSPNNLRRTDNAMRFGIGNLSTSNVSNAPKSQSLMISSSKPYVNSHPLVISPAKSQLVTRRQVPMSRPVVTAVKPDILQTELASVETLNHLMRGEMITAENYTVYMAIHQKRIEEITGEQETQQDQFQQNQFQQALSEMQQQTQQQIDQIRQDAQAQTSKIQRDLELQLGQLKY